MSYMKIIYIYIFFLPSISKKRRESPELARPTGPAPRSQPAQPADRTGLPQRARTPEPSPDRSPDPLSLSLSH